MPSRRAMCRLLAGGTVLSTAGCLSLDYRAEFDACGDVTGRPCSESDVPENPIERGTLIGTDETRAGTVISGASYHTSGGQTVVIHGLAAGVGDPSCHRIQLLQVRKDREELTVTVLSDYGDAGFSGGCYQTLATVPYRARIPVSVDSVASIRIRQLNGQFGPFDRRTEFEASVSL